ncbi:hypothetical protein [Streptomyces axinellae]|uniref:DUF742 domain-containing protein n=1 Tax=Streptomyces axinellae TaxID=552788 RepID=A0ABN3PND2_9ACTN
MVRKKVEGDEDQRRKAAHKAYREEESPSARHATTGASKQRAHRAGEPSRHSRGEESPVQREGKQGHSAEAPDAAPRSPVGPERPESPFQGRGHPGYSAEHEQVFAALVTAERHSGGRPVLLADIARAADRPEGETRVLVHDLVTAHHLVTELQGSDPVEGPRYETKPRR